jgi:glyoxylase-like metal-dependent hydrolase (beta-lactamase superfamily II)
VTIQTHVIGPLQNNTYVVVDDRSQRAAVIDPGMESEPVLEAIRSGGLTLEAVILTHGHFDHVFGTQLFRAATAASVVMHAADLPLLDDVAETARYFGFSPPTVPRPDRLVRDGEEIRVGGLALRVLETPGHTPGGISLLLDDAVFVGDALFAGSVGRTDLAGGSLEVLLRSILDRLLALPDHTGVYPGHGPATTIGVERRDNPFLQGVA